MGSKFKIVLCLLISLSLISNADARTRKGGQQISAKTVLMGVNASSLEAGSNVIPGTINVNYAQPSCAEMSYYHSKGLNIVRLPFLWERVQPTLGGALDTTYLSYITNVVTCAQTYSQKVLLDVHNFGSYNGNKVGSVSGPTYAQFANLWSRLATAFVGNNGVGGYDLMNEPNSMPSAAVVPAMYQAAVTAIRLVDTATPIYLEGDAFASAYGWLGNCANCGGTPIGGWANGGNNDLLLVTDPNNNLVFSAHAYGDSDNSGTYPTYPTASSCVNGNNTYQCAQTLGDTLTSPTSTLDTGIIVKRYTPFVNWCVSNNVKCHIGETGVPNDSQNWLTALDNGIAYLQAHNVQLTYWNAGPFYGSYILSVEPTNLGSANQIDKLQTSVLTKYSNSYLSTTYQISGPSRGTASVPSTSFTISYNALIKKPITLTPTDGGAGGSFLPSSLTFSSGFNGTANFTYTAPGTNVYAITTTNNVMLIDPTAIGYATISDQFLNANIIPYNIYALRKIYAPYIGPAVRLRRASDNAQQDFGFTGLSLNSPVNISAITSWLGGGNGYVVTWYDQSPNSNNLVIPYTGDAPQSSPTTSSQPQFILSCTNSLPCVYFNGSNAMQAVSPVNGNTAQSVLAVSAPTSALSQGSLVNWSFCCGQSSIGAFVSDTFNSSVSGTNRSYTQNGVWGTNAASFNSTVQYAVSNQLSVGYNSTSSPSINFPYRSNVNVGWTAFGGYYTGYVGELIIANNYLTPAQMSSFQSDEQSYWAITGFPSYTYHTATLAQNPSTANAPPWAGVNESGAVGNFGKNLNFITPAAGQTYYQTRGMNLIRLPVQWEQLQQNLCTASTTLDSTSLSQLDSDIALITAANMDVLIDLHNFGSYNYSYWLTCASPPDDGKWTSTTTSTYFVNFWTQLAARYASNPKVKFDLMNEPAGTTSTASATVQQSAITAIRGQNFNNYIFTEFGSTYASCSDVSTNAGPAFITLTDTQNKLVLECHNYLQPCNNDSCGAEASQGAALADLNTATTYCNAHGCHMYWGEFNETFTASMYSETKVAFDLLAANSSAWYGWAEFAGGPAWGETYTGLIEPRGFPTPYVDRPIMQILNTYATGNTWPSAGGAWPNNVQFP